MSLNTTDFDLDSHWSSRGLVLGEGDTAQNALDALERYARSQALEMARPIAEREAADVTTANGKLYRHHRKHPGVHWIGTFTVSAIRLAAGPVSAGSQGWVALGSLLRNRATYSGCDCLNE